MAFNWAYTHDDTTAGLFTTGNKEEWSDTIWNISPDDVPLLSAIGSGATASTRYEWYTEVLKAASAKNSVAKVQGFTPSPSTEPRVQCENYTMIFSDDAFISRTQEKQKKVGISSEMRHQITNKMVVLKKSFELACMARVTVRAPRVGTDAAYMHGLPGLVGKYGDKVLHFDGSTQQFGVDNTVNINIVEEDFQEDGTTYFGFSTFKAALKGVWKLGSRPKLCFCTPEDKEYVSLWDTSGVVRNSVNINKVEEMVDVVLTDFGNVRFIPHEDLTKYSSVSGDTFDGTANNMITDFALLIDPALIRKVIFDDFFSEPLAKTKDGDEMYLAVEATLETKAPHGIVIFNFSGETGFTTSVALSATEADYTAAY